MTTPSNIQIAFPKVTDTEAGGTLMVPPPAPVTPVNAGLVEVSKSPATRTKLSCSALLQGETLARAQAEAAKEYPNLLNNTAAFMNFGSGALTGVNSLIDQLLHKVDPIKIPELTALMKDLNGNMRKIRTKYDVADPKVREKYMNWKGGISRFIGKTRTLIDLLMEDVTSIETQLNRVGKTLKGRQNDLTKNVGYYDELYRQNEEEIGKVIYFVGVMELIRDLAAKEAAAIVVGDASLGDREGERKAKLAQFAENMDIKIAEYKGRLFVAWATSPSVRNMRALDISVAERLNEMLVITIPTMKATIVQWRMMMQTADAAKMIEAVSTSTNEWLTAFSNAGAELVPMIADTVETPTLLPQTIAAMADSLARQANGIVTAMEAGTRRREELDQAILDGGKVIADANAKISDALIASVVAKATAALPLEIATSVPVQP